MKTRAVDVYITMLLLSIAGLWVILSFGATLIAPTDLAGTWVTAPNDAPTAPGQVMTIEQSGRFFQISFDHGLQLKLRLDPHSLDPSLEKARQQLHLNGSPWHLLATGPIDGDELSLHLTGPQNYHWAAHRTARTFATTQPAGGAH